MHVCVCVLRIIIIFIFIPLHAVKSFLELVPYLLSLPNAPPFVSRRISQDPLEKFFGLQRQRGKVNEHPSVQEFIKNTQALRVIKIAKISIKGNCREDSIIDQDECCPIKKRKT